VKKPGRLGRLKRRLGWGFGPSQQHAEKIEKSGPECVSSFLLFPGFQQESAPPRRELWVPLFKPQKLKQHKTK